MISRDSISTSHQDLKRMHLVLLEKDDKRGRKEDLVTTQTLRFQKQNVLASPSKADLVVDKRRSEVDHGRLVHGIKNAFAI